MRLIFLLICTIIMMTTSNAQVQMSIYNSSNSLLPDNNVFCIRRDLTNNYWIGTDFGLVKVDSLFNWTVYNTTNSGLPNNSIRSIFIDPSNKKWIGTFNGGIACYNDTSWIVINAQNSLLPDDHIRSMAMDDSSYLWAATTGGLAVFRDTNWTVYNMFNSPLMSNNIASILIDDSTVNLGTINGGLVIIENTVWNVYLFPTALPDNTVLDLDKDINGNLWMAFANAGVGARVPQTGSILLYNTTTSTIMSNNATSVLVYTLMKQYAGSIDKGLILKNGVYFQNLDPNNSMMPDFHVRSIFLSDSTLWLGTATGGLVVINELSLDIESGSNYNTAVTIYPNPVVKKLLVKSAQQINSLLLQNVIGVPYMNLDVHDREIELDLDHLSDGMYILTIIYGNKKSYSTKVIKQSFSQK